jgi:hypothetical protein
MKWDSLFQNQSASLHSAHSKTFSHLNCLIYIFSSPDFDALDLGAWYSLAAGVPSLKSIPNQRQRTIDRIPMKWGVPSLEKWGGTNRWK